MEKSQSNKNLFRTTCTNKNSLVSGTKVFCFFILVCHDSVLVISFHPMCIFQYTTALMFVFIVLLMIVMILLTAVPTTTK